MSATDRTDPREPRPALRVISSEEHPEGPAPRLKITVRGGQGLDGVALVVATGEIDAYSATRLRTAVVALMTCRRYVIVDLDDATYVDTNVLPDLIDATCAEVTADVTLLFTDDPRSLLMLKVSAPAP